MVLLIGLKKLPMKGNAVGYRRLNLWVHSFFVNSTAYWINEKHRFASIYNFNFTIVAIHRREQKSRSTNEHSGI